MRTPPVQPRDLRVLALILAAGLLFSGVLSGQTSAPVTSAPSPQAATIDRSPTDTHSLSKDQLAGSIPTASQIQAKGERSPDAADPIQAQAKTNAYGAQPAAAPPPAVVQPAPQQSKYDVTLIGRRNIGTGLNFYSLEREIAVGQEFAKQVEETSKLVTDPAIIEYVNRIGQNLVRNSDSRVPFTIKVIDSGEINAFALPGGFFYVDSGLILAAESESELAAIMAHEIAHVAARHATKNMTKQQIWNMASIPLMFVGGPAGYAIAEVANIVVPMSFLKFSRDSEREADMLGLQYDYAAGYDPQAFVQFFERLKSQEKQKHSKIAKMFATHPMTADRITAAQAEIQKYLPDRDSYIVDTSDFEAMKARLLSLQGNQRLTTDKRGDLPVLRMHTDDDGASDSQAPTGVSSTKPTTD